MRIIPYSNFPGNAEGAMTFYQEVFGGNIELQRWSEMPPNPQMPVSDDWQNKIMHGALDIREEVTVYLSDSWTEGEATGNNNVFLHVEFDSEDELRRVFDALSAGGTVNMPVDRTFWGAVYGDLVDKFGIGWGLHYQLPE
jgi:PhnB protein